MSGSKNRAKVISDDNPAAQELAIVLSKLGVSQTPKIYLYKALAYIGIETLLPVLLIPPQQVKKILDKSNYITLSSKKIYANKKGILCLIATSKAPAADHLINYIFEIIRKLETQDVVTKKEVKTRTDLDNTKKYRDTINELEINQSTLFQQITEAKEELDQAQEELALNTRELDKLKSDHKDLQSEHDELTEKYKSLMKSAKALLKYVKTSTRGRPKNVEMIELSDDSDAEYTEDEKAQILYDALKAKKKLSGKKKSPLKKLSGKKKSPKSSPTKKRSKLDPDVEQSIYHVCHSRESAPTSSGDRTYRWELKSQLPPGPFHILDSDFKDFKELSSAVRSGDCATTSHEFLWYRDVALNQSNYNKLNDLINVLVNYSEIHVMDQLINIMTKDS